MHVSEFAKTLPPHERVEFLRDSVTDPTIAALALGDMKPGDAAQILALPTDEIDAWEHLDWVRFAASDEGSMEAGQRLLNRMAHEPNQYHAHGLLQRMVKMDPTHPELQSMLHEGFANRVQSDGRFWEALAWNAHTLGTDHLMAAVHPFLERSQGEVDPHRLELVALVQERIPDSVLE